MVFFRFWSSCSAFLALRSVCDVDVNAVADCCPNLEQLDILGTALVGPESIQRYVASYYNFVQA